MIENYGRYIKITVDGMKFTSNDIFIRAWVDFDDDSKPNETRVEFTNLSDKTVSKFKRGHKMTVDAGYKSDHGVLSVGVIYKVYDRWQGTDRHTTLYALEGDDFSKIKVDKSNATKKYEIKGGKKVLAKSQPLSISFKKNTDGMTIIKKLINVLGIKLEGKIDIKRNKVYKKGYSCTQVILNDLEQVVRDCGSIMYHRRGKLVIRPINKGVDERFLISENTGMIGSPNITIENGLKSVRIRCLLQHRITTCSIIDVRSRFVNGKYRAFKGQHIMEKEKFYTEFYGV